jgi:hypothetical protein
VATVNVSRRYPLPRFVIGYLTALAVGAAVIMAAVSQAGGIRNMESPREAAAVVPREENSALQHLVTCRTPEHLIILAGLTMYNDGFESMQHAFRCPH